MKAYAGKLLFTTGVIVHILPLVLALFAFQRTRYCLMVLLTLLSVVDGIYGFIVRRFPWKALLFDLLAMSLMAGMLFPFHAGLESVRFAIYEERYSSVAASLTRHLSSEGDASWVARPLDDGIPLSTDNRFLYSKHGESILLYFPTWVGFSRSSGFLYFSDATARDFLEHPSRYDPGLSTEKSYETQIALNSNWAYVILY